MKALETRPMALGLEVHGLVLVASSRDSFGIRSAVFTSIAVINPKKATQQSEYARCQSLACPPYPDPREDLESRSPNLGPYTTKGTLSEPPLRDLLFGSSRGLGMVSIMDCSCMQGCSAPQVVQLADTPTLGHYGLKVSRVVLHSLFPVVSFVYSSLSGSIGKPGNKHYRRNTGTCQ